MDKLKEYLLRHKADLDVDSPASDTWEYIGSKMQNESHQPGLATRSSVGTRSVVGTRSGFPAKSGSSTWAVRYAAAACVIALAGAGLWLGIRNNQAPSDTAKHDSRT